MTKNEKTEHIWSSVNRTEMNCINPSMAILLTKISKAQRSMHDGIQDCDNIKSFAMAAVHIWQRIEHSSFGTLYFIPAWLKWMRSDVTHTANDFAQFPA